MNKNTYKFIDSHAHIFDSKLNPKQIINDMQSDNLDKIITVGYDIKSSKSALCLAEKNQNVYATVGVHPSDVKKMKDSDLQTLFTLSQNPKTIAIGEIGLDYHYEDTDKENQKNWLLKQIDLVEQAKLPAVIHLRDAYDDMQKIVTDNLKKFKSGGVFHCFSGSKQTALFYASKGFYISFTGVITYKNSAKFRDIIKALPKDKILIETDCPYLTPEPFRGEVNRPAYVSLVAEEIADILQMQLEDVAKLTCDNTYKLFTKMSNKKN